MLGITPSFYSKSLNLCTTLCRLLNRKEDLKTLNYIRENTTSRVKIPLHILEYIYDRDRFRTLDTEYEIEDNEITLGEIITELNKAYTEITIILSRIAKEREIDIMLPNIEAYMKTEVK
jgi:hypothetical protein